MSIEHDQSTRKAMRAGISGENVLRPLDEFSVTRTISEKDGSAIASNNAFSYWRFTQDYYGKPVAS